jgi:NADH-quinone oxidoreductase subunit B
MTAGLACCTLEVEAAVAGGHLVPIHGDADKEPQVIVIAGTVTDALVPSVLEHIEQYPHAQIMSFGACATSGGPYWDSPPVSKGIDQFADVAVYVAGCPPRPEALIAALVELAVSATP